MKVMPKTLRLRNRRWRLILVSNLRADGECDSPEAPQKTIRVAKRLRGLRQLVVFIHEMLHACQWDLAEEATTQIAEDVGYNLWRLGYRIHTAGRKRTGSL